MPTGGGGPGGSGGAGASGSAFDACVAAQDGLIDAACDPTDLGRFEWIGAAAGECIGSTGSNQVAQALFSLDAVDEDGNPSVLGLRLDTQTGDAPVDGDRLELTAATPVLVTPGAPLPAELDWPAVLEPMVFGGALSFLRGETNDVELTLDRALTLDELTAGDAEVSGTFHLRGGTYVVLDDDGVEQEIVDPEAEVVGCFVVPIIAHPIELDP